MFRLFSLKPFVLCLSVVSLFVFAPKAHATCGVQCSGKLIFDDCSAPQDPKVWPSHVLPTFQVECKTCCSAPGGPLQCSDSSFNATDFVLRDAQGLPLSGTFSLLTKSCNNKTLLQYSQSLSPAKGYDLLSRVPGGGNLILLQFDVVASSQESHNEQHPEHSEVLPDPEQYPEHSEVLPDPEQYPEHSEVLPDPEQHPEHSEGGNPDEPVQDNPPTDDTMHDHPPIDNPPVDTPPTDRKIDDGGPDDTVRDACGTPNPDASSPDEMPRDGCGPTPPPDNAPTDNAPTDNAATDDTVKDSKGWGCEATSPAPTGLFFLLFGALFFTRRRTRWNV